jgi:hypothetical protein
MPVRHLGSGLHNVSGITALVSGEAGRTAQVGPGSCRSEHAQAVQNGCACAQGRLNGAWQV